MEKGIKKLLIMWKYTLAHKLLLKKGCRQCGKNYSVLDFL